MLTLRAAGLLDIDSGSMTQSSVEAPLSGTRGCRHASIGNDTLISE